MLRIILYHSTRIS